MRFNLSDFRCFHKPDQIELRPITLLVGENSAGKTSFLSALRFFLELMRREPGTSFNKDPFHLGSYDDIAHYRGGKFGRAKSFSFSLTGAVSVSPRDLRPQLEIFKFEDSGPHIFDLKVSFENYKSQPALKTLSISAAPFFLEATFDEEVSVVVSTPSNKNVRLPDFRGPESRDYLTHDISYIEYLLRDFRFIARREGTTEVSPLLREEILYLSELYRAIVRTASQPVYASSPVRTKPERTYNPGDISTAPDGSHTPYLLAQLTVFDPLKWKSIQSDLVSFGQSSGLFDDLLVKQVSGRKDRLGPFQIVVNMNGRKSNIADVGYGVSQAIPIISDVLQAKRATLFLLQQPEVHLHPRAQAALGSFFGRIAKLKRHRFVIETHSDFIIDRLRMNVRDGLLRKNDVSVLFFERQHHDVQIHQIEFDEAGNVVGAPPSYRRFFIEEEMESLGLGLKEGDRDVPHN